MHLPVHLVCIVTVEWVGTCRLLMVFRYATFMEASVELMSILAP